MAEFFGNVVLGKKRKAVSVPEDESVFSFWLSSAIKDLHARCVPSLVRTPLGIWAPSAQMYRVEPLAAGTGQG